MEFLRGSLILTISNVTVRALGYLYRILMGRMLSPYEFGLLNLALPLQYMVVILASSGIAPSIAKFVAQYRAADDPKKRDRAVYSSLVHFTAIGGVFGMFFYLLAEPLGAGVFHTPGAVELIKISSLAMPIGFAVASLTGAFQGYKRFDFMAVTLISQQVLRVLLAMLLVFFGYGVLGAITGSTLGFIAVLPLAVVLLRRLNLGAFASSAGEFKEILIFSLPVTATSLASFVLAYVDILLLGYYLTPPDVGVYAAASPTSRLLLALFAALYAALLPAISELKAKGDLDGIRAHVRKAYRLSMLAIIPSTFLALRFSESIISILFPSAGYSAAVEPFKILVIGTAFLGIFTLNSGIYNGLGMPRMPMKILATAAFLDILLNLGLIPLYGIRGAAVASTVSFAFAGIISMVNLRKHL